MSTHGIQWFPQYASAESIKATADAGANLFRIAMYTAENGYISDKNIKNTVINAADAAISNDMYVIIDWHILSDGNPQTYKSEAKQFFTEMAERYADSPAVLYEICNEPNGNVSWKNDIKPYAEEMIQTIRAIDSDAIILVGSSTWSQDLDKAAESPISASNIMYTCHFYAGTHTQWLRDRITAAMKAGLPVFISEWGTSDASGNGGVYLDEAQKWIDFMNQNNISWANWSLCDKNESSAALISGASPSGGWSQAELTASGKFVFSKF
jgi:endoglucanase